MKINFISFFFFNSKNVATIHCRCKKKLTPNNTKYIIINSKIEDEIIVHKFRIYYHPAKIKA